MVRWVCVVFLAASACQFGRPYEAPDGAVGGFDASAPDASADSPPDAGLDGGGFVAASHTAFPQLPRLPGPTLPSFRLVTIVTEGDAFVDTLKAFGAFLPRSQWFASVAEEYGLGPPGPTDFLLGPAIPAGSAASPVPFTDTQVRQYLAARIAANPRLAPDGKTIYLLYLPDGVTSPVGSNDNVDCSEGSGYHSHGAAISASNDAYAVVQRCPTFDPIENPPVELLTTVASHEVIEAATDPRLFLDPAYQLTIANGAGAWTQDPWVEVEGYVILEVGDLCLATRVYESDFAFQRIFSNRLAAANAGDPCMPVPSTPFYNVSDVGRWYAAAPGSTVTIQLTAWASGPRPDWYVQAIPNNSTSDSSRALVATLQGPTAVVGGVTYLTANNGQSIPLVVQVPASAPPGWWSTVLINSFDADANDYTPAGEDFAQEWIVGVYVP